MNKVKFKKILCVLLTASMATCNLTACSNINAKGVDEGSIVVLDDQEEDINDILAIKQIIEVKDFVGFHWLDDNRILGVAIKDGIRNIAIYNSEDDTTENLTNNKDLKNKCFKFWHEIIGCITQYDIPKDYVIFEEIMLNRDYEEPYALLAYDIKEDELIRIDENITDDQLVDDTQLYYAKGFEVYKYDMVSKQKTEIELPKELSNNLKDYFDSYEEYLDMHYGEDREELSELVKESCLELYKNQKNNNHIEKLKVKGNELEIVSYNYNNFILNMKTNTFKKGYIESDTVPYKYVSEIGDVAKLIQNKIPRELWKIDNKGNSVKMIDKTHDFVGGFYLSPDKNKLIYELIYSRGEERKYIYDFKSDKKVTIFGEYEGTYWNKESNKLVCAQSVFFAEELKCKIVIFND